MAGNLGDLQKKLDHAARKLPDMVLQVFEVEGLKFIEKNFRDQGFNDAGLNKWKKRKTTDRKGRDLTRYRTNRKGTAGSLTKFGREDIGRAILVGHETGGDKLKLSFRARKEARAVKFYTYKKYAQRHNEGLKGMPKRQFMGKSKYLTDQINNKITRQLDILFRS